MDLTLTPAFSVCEREAEAVFRQGAKNSERGHSCPPTIRIAPRRGVFLARDVRLLGKSAKARIVPSEARTSHCIGKFGGQECPRYMSRGGFTLIELMVVLTIIAVMMGVIVAEMTGTREDAILRASARKVIDVLNLASSRAITLGQTHRVQFEPAKHSFEVRRKVHEPGEGFGFVSLKDAAGSIGQWDERIELELPQPEPEEGEDEPDETRQAEYGSVSFYADGTADPFRVILRDRQGFEVVLKVTPASGRVKANHFESP